MQGVRYADWGWTCFIINRHNRIMRRPWEIARKTWISILETPAEIRLGVSMILQTWTSRHMGKVSEWTLVLLSGSISPFSDVVKQPPLARRDINRSYFVWPLERNEDSWKKKHDSRSNNLRPSWSHTRSQQLRILNFVCNKSEFLGVPSVHTSFLCWWIKQFWYTFAIAKKDY